MTKITYTATDKNGEEQTNYIDVENNKQAIEKLKSQGFNNINLHDNAAFKVIENELLDRKPQWQLKRLAKFELISRKDNSIFTVLKENIILNWWVILTGFVLIGFGFFQNRSMTVVFGIVLTAILPTITIWRFRHGRRYRRIRDLQSFGQWENALKEIKIHRKLKEFPEHLHDLDFIEASILAKTGNLDKALKLVSKWEKAFDKSNPGYYEARLSGVYDSADEIQMYLKMSKINYDKSNDPMFSSIDLAMAEAKYGDSDKALNLIENINSKELPDIAQPYLNWINGIVSKRKTQYPQAKIFLEKALMKLVERQGEMLVEPSIATCSGELAVVLNKLGDKQTALQLISNVSTVLKAHGYKSLLKEISEFTNLK